MITSVVSWATIRIEMLFRRIDEKPDWVMIFFLVGMTSVLISHLTSPYALHVAGISLSASFDSEDAAKTLDKMRFYRIIALLFIPVQRMVKWLILASLIYFSAVLWNAQKIKYKQAFCVVVYAELVLTLMAAVNLALLSAKDLSEITGPMDLNTVVGLDIFLHNKFEQKILYSFLNAFNIFSLAYILMLIKGVSVVSGLSSVKSSVIVLGIWISGVLLQVSIVALTTRFISVMGS